MTIEAVQFDDDDDESEAVPDGTRPYRVTFKRLKRHVKIMVEQDNDGGLSVQSWSFKYSMAQWEDLTKNKPEPFKEGPPGMLAIDTGYSSYYCDQRFKKDGLIDQYPYSYQEKSGHYKSHTFTRRQTVLTKLGEAVLKVLPKCPPREDWAPPPPSAERSRENIRVTPAQKQMFKDWPKRKYMAVPINGDKAEESRWIADGHYPRASTACMLKMELIEPGVSGMALVDGRLVLDEDNSSGVKLVYRLTILGALIANND